MSLVYILYHDESVYTYDDHKKITDNIKLPRYRSLSKKYSSSLGITRNNLPCSCNEVSKKYQWKTMGIPEVPLYHPSNFLKKNSGVRYMKQKNHQCIKREAIPVPRHNEIVTLPEHPKKDFISRNVEVVNKMVPKRSCPKYAYTAQGDVHTLSQSGLMPEYIFSPNFGKVPQYLHARVDVNLTSSQEQQDQHEYQKNLKNVYSFENLSIAKNGDQCNLKQISPEERLLILSGLKQNWSSYFTEYEKLPVLTDTLPKIRRKVDIRKSLADLEKDIIFIENNPLIYVKEDNQ